MQASDPPQHKPKFPRQTIALFHGLALLLLAIDLYIRTLPPTLTPIPEPTDPEAAWWGFWPVTYAPTWAVWIGIVMIVGGIVAFWLWELGSWGVGEKGRKGEEQHTHYALRTTHYVLLALALFACFFLFPIVHTRWGDAYILAKGIAYPDPALRTVYSWQAPLDVFLHSQVWRWLGVQLGAIDDATPIYRLLSPLAGAIYLAVVLAISRDRRIAPGWLSFGLLSSLGLMQLFFGYIENYSFVAAGILCYLWLGIGVLNGERPLWLAASVLAICNAFHPSTIVLAPSLLYLGWFVGSWGDRETGRPGDGKSTQHTTHNTQTVSQFAIHNSQFSSRNTQLLSIVLQIGLPMILVASGTMVLMEWGGHGLTALFSTDKPGGGDGSWFVPLWQTHTRWEHYTMFSWLHLREWLNGQMLVAPAVLGTVFVTMLVGVLWIKKKETKDKETREQGGKEHLFRTPHSALRTFLFIATICYLLFTFVWNADYGGQRDWDLFSLSALPLTMLLIVQLPTWLNEQHLRMAMFPLIALQALHTMAWIYQNTLPWEWPK